MKIVPIYASWFKKQSEFVQKSVIASGGIPVNDIFYDDFANTNPINLFYGSYGSGKSVVIVDILLAHCINDPYFRCYYGRKVFDTVRPSVFKTITDRIKDLGYAHLFSFSDAPNGTMQIVCKTNGNQFFPFGASDSESLKSIKDPTHFFCEEFDQFSHIDFGFIYSRLRTEKAITQFYGSFNTEYIYKTHWIRVTFFENNYYPRARKIKANYYHNYFINQTDYEEKLRGIAAGKISVYNAIAHGEWGAVRTGGEFWKQFDEEKHVKKVSYQPGVIYLSFDENVVPYVSCTIWQVKGKVFKQIHEITAESPNNNAPKCAWLVADWLRKIEHTDVIFVCGDPSASKRSTVDENSKSFYDKAIGVLTDRRFKVFNKVMRSAPEVALSGAFVNEIYEKNLYGWNIEISDTCFFSIDDYMKVKEDAEGRMLKVKIKNELTGQTYEENGHLSDTKRYFILTVLWQEFQNYKGIKSNLAKKIGYLRR